MTTFGEIPRGLNDAWVAPITGVSTVGQGVDIPGVRVLGWNTESSPDTLEGDDQVIAKAASAPTLTASLETGRINLAAMAVLLGQVVVLDTTGADDEALRSMAHPAAANTSQCRIIGQSLDADYVGSAYRVHLLKMLAGGGPDESLEVNAWSTPTIELEGTPVDGNLLIRQQFEVAEALTSTFPVVDLNPGG